MLSIRQLRVSIDDTVIIKRLDLCIEPGSIYALMGPNGSGKSTVAHTIMGHPAYKIIAGDILFEGHSIVALSPDKRAKMGIFLSFQQPYAIPGVTIFTFLKSAFEGIHGACTVSDFKARLETALIDVGLDTAIADRHLNVGFSGGERKRLEMAQILILRPKLVILDEIDSGLDVDALRIIAACLNRLKKEQPSMSILCITHYQRILDYIIPDFVHVMHDGAIIHAGTADVAHLIEAQGYSGLINE